ncbi:unnamed protein product [Soboliphyme baturini]|uniref:DUF4801 domain-containing protein n=1 Tax=Soboliphyme baturini TaxID=241478 RepID=A0A183IZN6_9BILA|nr:unnamed protein product [Soboliphyme baturini]
MKTCPSIKCPYRPPICITVTGHDGCQQCACEIPDEVFSLEEYVETTTGQAGTTPPLPESYTILEAAPSETSTEVFRTGSEKLQLMTKSQSDKVQRKSADKHKPIAVLSLSAETKMVDTMINLRKNECTKEDKAIIDKNFRTLHEFIMERAGESDIFPIVYSLDDGTLAAKCYNYKVANVNTPLSARRRCFKRYRIYDDVYYTLAYPCRKATKEDFFEHFNCLREVFLTPEYKSCLPQGFPRIIKAQNLCKMFNEILQCSSNVINENCGLNALEIQYQYLSIVVKKIRPNCHLKRVDLLKIFR